MNKVLVVADGHYYRDKNGGFFVDSVFDYSFYKRYLDAFDEVYAIVRTQEVEISPAFSKKASGPNVHFLPIDDTVGALQYLKKRSTTKKQIQNYLDDFNCAIFRVPGVTANEVYHMWPKNKKYALEVVVDPWEYFAKGTVKGVSRVATRILWTTELKIMCNKANGVSYVTRQYLQKRYPCKALSNVQGYFTESYSSVELPDDSFSSPRVYEKKEKYLISHVAASFTSYGKGHVTLIKALKILVDKGINIEVNFIGDGPLKEKFLLLAEDLGILDHIHFLGLLSSGSAVREAIGKTDMFVFPTMAEGLPRVVLEAMSEGLPVLSSPVCGIPEIIEPQYLIDFDNYEGYAEKIETIINNPQEMTEMSKRNVETAYKYRKSVLQEKRKSFYQKLRDASME